MYKLLIVEDEHLIRRYLTGALDYQELNITVVGDAENGQEGTAMIQDLQPDIVLTDISMPIMDAFQMFEATKAQDYQKVILSGYNDFTNAKRRFAVVLEIFWLSQLIWKNCATVWSMSPPRFNCNAVN